MTALTTAISLAVAEAHRAREKHGDSIEAAHVPQYERLGILTEEVELRTLRAAMPTEEEREALVELADEVRSLLSGQPQAEVALAALDKLTKGGA